MRFLTWGEKLGDPECPYMQRWVINFRLFSIRVHRWWRSDDKRAQHDHPWWFITWIIKGSYTDWGRWVCQHCKGSGRYPRASKRICSGCGGRGGDQTLRKEFLKRWSIRYRPANHIHTVDVTPGGCWTIMLTGPDKKDWGFYIPRGKTFKYRRRSKYFIEEGHHPCDQL